MPSSARLVAALKRFHAALASLETATGQLAETDLEGQRLRDTIASMRRELETSMTRTQVLEQVTADVATRLGKAGTTLRRLLDVRDPSGV